MWVGDRLLSSILIPGARDSDPGAVPMADLTRLLRPASIAVVGGGEWGRNILRNLDRAGYGGDVWPVHPKAAEVGGRRAFRAVSDLPGVPDAAYVAVNRDRTVEAVGALAELGAGGAVCFASGFLEAEAEVGDGAALQAALLDAAGAMPILGPNCYGFLNNLDGAVLWPDQHGGVPVERGVAIISQSSNMAINISMQKRGLPIAYLVTAGNQAQVGLSAIGAALLDDPRVTALGLHIEGIDSIRGFEALASKARDLGKRIVALKVGRSAQARAATVSHTASLAGSDAGGAALLERLGIARVGSLPALLETLKLLHVVGPLRSNRIASVSCSGGEASLMADAALGHDLEFPVLEDGQAAALRDVLGPKVALANPLDYHTYIWRDRAAIGRCFAAMMTGDVALGLAVLDFPRADRADPKEWYDVTHGVAVASRESGRPMAIVATLPELMPENEALKLLDAGIVPLAGVEEAMEAIAAAAWLGQPVVGSEPVLLPGAERSAALVNEAAAKQLLSGFGVPVPSGLRANGPVEAGEAARTLGGAVVLKGLGLAHKSEAGAVVLGLTGAEAVERAARAVGGDGFLVEKMVEGGVLELLVGVVRDPAHGFVLTLGAGGRMTELLGDSASALAPASRASVGALLDRLKCVPLIAGFRGAPAADREATIDAVMAIQDAVVQHADTIEEIEVNPLIATPNGAVAADALIRMAKEDT